MHLPAEVGSRTRRDQLRQSGQGGELLCTRCSASEGLEAVAPQGSLLVAEGLGQAAKPLEQCLLDHADVVEQGSAGRVGQRCVALDVDRTVARCEASPHLGQDARGGGGSGGADARSARAQGNRSLDGLDGLECRTSSAERAEVGGSVVGVVADPTYDRQTWEGLGRELDPDRALRVAAAPVVARCQLGNEAKLADLGLKRRGAGDGIHALREPHHLGHAGALLRCGEIAAHTGTDPRGLADVQRAALRVAEDVDAGDVGERLGEVALASLRRGHPGRVGRELLEGVDSERPDAVDEAVQDVDGGARIGQRPVVGRGRRPEVRGESAELAVAHLVAEQDRAGEPRRVDDCRLGPRAPGAGARTLEERHVIGRVVCDQDRTCGELEERRQCGAQRRRIHQHRVGDPGEHRDERRDGNPGLHEGLEFADHLAAPHLDRPDLGDAGVGGGAPGGLEVHHDEGHLRQGSAEIVERGLLGAALGEVLRLHMCARHGDRRQAHEDDARRGVRRGAGAAPP